MIGKQDRWQEDLFVAGPLRDLVPDDHVLKRVHQALDLSWLREEVSDCYDESLGRPSIDPEAAVRLMLAGFFQGIVHDRKLMREAQVNLAIRWFAGYRLHETLPDHSSLTRIRQRWGVGRFKKIFQRTVEQCIRKGLVNAETVHVDATLIRADVSWKSLVEVHVEKVVKENAEDGPDGPGASGKREKAKKRSTTDPDCTMTTNRSDQRMEPAYKQHVAVEDKSGVIVDVEVTTGEVSEGKRLLGQLERVEAMTKQKVKRVTGDAGYAHAANYAALEERETEAVIPPPEESRKCKHIPLRRFKYDGKHNVVKCPRGKVLSRASRDERGRWYRARRADCQGCPVRERCLSGRARSRQVLIVDGYSALLRARRRRSRWDDQTYEQYERHRWRVEGRHGEAKTQHGLRRAARRGLWNMEIQSYLTAAVLNLKRLAALLSAFLCWLERRRARSISREGMGAIRTERIDLCRSGRRAA
jgi:transposase